MTILTRAFFLLVSFWVVAESAGSEAEVGIRKDIVYAEVNGQKLALDFYFPRGGSKAPLIVWVHGGAWRSGDKSSLPLGSLLRDGYALASVDYRLTPVAPFPAQVHDIKAAIRFLRAQAAEFGIDPARIGIAGNSAGGHLAALVGVSNGHPQLEGSVGWHREHSSDVSAIVSFYGASNLQTILAQSTPHGLGVRIPALQLLLGGQPEKKPDAARLASPVAHIDPRDPPLLLIHGDQDPQMPINQSHELHGAYLKAGLPTQLEVVHGGAHGGDEFYDEERMTKVRAFLKDHLKNSRFALPKPDR